MVSLHRFPIKSMLGLQVPHITLDRRGCVGDRMWCVRTATGKIGSGKNTRRFAAVPGLLALRAEERDGRLSVSFPDGTSCSVDAPDVTDRLTRYLKQPVTLARESDEAHFDDGPVSLIGLASIKAVARAREEPIDPVRFRPNVVFDTDLPLVEEEWIGQHVHVGTAVLSVELASPRCVMVDAETADLPAQPGVLAAVGTVNQARLGVVARVITPGTIAVGDSIHVHPPQRRSDH